MTICLKIKKNNAQAIIENLQELDLIDTTKEFGRDDKFLYIPIINTSIELEDLGEIVDYSVQDREHKPNSIEGFLQDTLTSEELDDLKTSFDLIGNIAVVEIPVSLVPKEGIIGKAFLKFYPQLKTIIKKESAISGQFRTRDFSVIAGEKSTQTRYKEHGIIYDFDLSQIYFTPRLATERLIIAKQVQPNEIILDMFAGVGPFSILIAKIQPAINKIIAFDINPMAISALNHNAQINKVVDQIDSYVGDAQELVSKICLGRVDRVIMNHPSASLEFINDALTALKSQGGIIHYYTFDDTEESVKQKLSDKFSSYKHRFLAIRKVRNYSPCEFNFVADVHVQTLI